MCRVRKRLWTVPRLKSPAPDRRTTNISERLSLCSERWCGCKLRQKAALRARRNSTIRFVIDQPGSYFIESPRFQDGIQ